MAPALQQRACLGGTEIAAGRQEPVVRGHDADQCARHHRPDKHGSTKPPKASAHKPRHDAARSAAPEARASRSRAWKLGAHWRAAMRISIPMRAGYSARLIESAAPAKSAAHSAAMHAHACSTEYVSLGAERHASDAAGSRRLYALVRPRSGSRKPEVQSRCERRSRAMVRMRR